MTDTSKHQRRWYQFSLRTMLAVMVLLSAVFGYWVHCSKEWIRQRQEWRRRQFPIMGSIIMKPLPVAPGGLWLFGEGGTDVISCSESDVEMVKRLFPEARRILIGPTRSTHDIP